MDLLIQIIFHLLGRLCVCWRFCGLFGLTHSIGCKLKQYKINVRCNMKFPWNWKKRKYIYGWIVNCVIWWTWITWIQTVALDSEIWARCLIMCALFSETAYGKSWFPCRFPSNVVSLFLLLLLVFMSYIWLCFQLQFLRFWNSI